MKNQAVPRRNQQGSAIIWIFVLVALFGMLSFVVAQSSRDGIGQVSNETAKLAATEVAQYLNKVRNTVSTLIINGCDPLKISFVNSTYLRVNGTAVELVPPGATNNCSVYHSSGGNLTPEVISEAAKLNFTPDNVNSQWPMHFSARYANTGLGSTENDLIYRTIGMDLNICLQFIKIHSADPSNVTSVPTGAFSTAGNNSYTQGTAGSLPLMPLIQGSNFFAYKLFSYEVECTMGIVLKAF